MKPEHSIIHEFESNISKLKIVGNIFITFYNRNKSTAFIVLIRNSHTHTHMYQNFKRGHTQLNVYTHTVLFYHTYKKNCNRMKFDIMTSFDVEQYLVFVF